MPRINAVEIVNGNLDKAEGVMQQELLRSVLNAMNSALSLGLDPTLLLWEEAKWDEQFTIREGIIVDPGNRSVNVENISYDLNRSELRLLLILHRNKGRFVSNETLSTEIWGNSFGRNSSLRNVIKETRRKIGDKKPFSIIKNKNGQGYEMV
jgi:DNA-binding response OmpR family regulator